MVTCRSVPDSVGRAVGIIEVYRPDKSASDIFGPAAHKAASAQYSAYVFHLVLEARGMLACRLPSWESGRLKKSNAAEPINHATASPVGSVSGCGLHRAER